MSGAPVDPRLDRYRPLTRALQWALVACVVVDPASGAEQVVVFSSRRA